MKKATININNIFFLVHSLILLVCRKYKKIILYCDERDNKIGETYESHYVRMHTEYYLADYSKSYKSYKYLLENSYLNKETVDWGIQLFIETPIVKYKQYSLVV
jgi:hypothetical protein